MHPFVICIQKSKGGKCEKIGNKWREIERNFVGVDNGP